MDGDYYLANDLDEDTPGYDELVDTSEGWNPILHFGGTFDGNGHTISDLYIDGDPFLRLGLFGWVEDDGRVENVGVVNVNVEVTGSSSEGTGGLVGSNYGVVSNSYSTGSVTAENVYQVGGLVGSKRSGGSVNNSYWNIETSGQNSSDGGKSRTTDEMTWEYSSNTYEGWDMARDGSSTWISGNHHLVKDHEGNTGYPALQWPGIELNDLEVTIDGEEVEVMINYMGNSNSGSFGPGEEIEIDYTGDMETGDTIRVIYRPADQILAKTTI